MRVQIKRQQNDIQDLQRAGISTKSAIELLERMHTKVDEMISERNRLNGEALLSRKTYVSGKVILGTPSYRR
jgi:phage shock protein A